MAYKNVARSDSFSGALNEARVASTAGGGSALTTTAIFVALPNGTTHVGITPRNFSTAVVAKFALNPYLLILKTTNALATLATDFSVTGQQNPATASAINLNAFPTAGFLYIGSHELFRGVAVTMSGSVNANASVLTVKYWNGAWTAVSGFTDNTASGGATFAQSGNVVWTVPTDAVKTTLAPTASAQVQQKYDDKPRYWTQWSVSGALSATVAANLMLSMNRDSSHYGESIANVVTQFRTFKGPDGLGNVELLTDAGTANAIVNCYTDNPGGSF